MDNYGTITGGSFAEVLNRNGGTGSSLALITGGTFDKVSNYGNMTGGTVGTLRNFDTTNYGHTVQGVTVTGSLYNSNSVCYSMDLRIALDDVHDGFGSITYVAMTVDGQTVQCAVGRNAKQWLNTNVASATWYKMVDGVKTPLTDTEVIPCQPVEYVSNLVTMIVNGVERLCPAGEPANAWLRKVESNDWYRLDSKEWVKLTDTDVFPDTRTVYSTIPGKSLGTSGWMQDINGNWIALVGETLGVFNSSAVWYVGDQPVEGTNWGFRVTYTVQKQDLGKDAVAVLTDGYATIRSSTIRIVGSLSVTVPAAVAAGETITPVFNWQLQNNPTTGMTYQWSRDNSPIEGATSCTYATTQADVEHKLTLAISVRGALSYTTSEVSVAANAATITGVSAAAELEYNGKEQNGYTGTPSSDYSGEYDITYTGRNGTVYNSTTPPTNAGDYTVTFAVPADNTTYAGRKSLDFSIAKATITIQADDKSAYVGDTAPEMTYTVTGLVSGEALKSEPTLAYETEPDMTKAGTTTIKVSGAEAPEGGNYEITYVYGTLTVSARPSSGDSTGGSSVPTYPPTVTQPENGSVTVSPKSPKKGDTVTIAPNPEAGYTVEQILVTDKNGDAVEVTNNGDGTYSFTQPAGKVNVKVTFMNDNTMLNFFVDVPANAYYHDAVLWAAKNGITGGIDDTHFAPNATCTRAQAMTFIYRREQAQRGGMQGEWMFLNPFTDVNLESYYGEAVMWAVANGITSGTTATTFSPNANCTRAQIVTFLFNYLGK